MSIIDCGSVPESRAVWTSLSMDLLFPLSTSMNIWLLPSRSLPVLPPDAPLPGAAISRALTFSIYRTSLSSLKRSISEAYAAFISIVCEGLAIAIVRPRSMAIVRNAVLTNIRSGRPNEIFERPHIVAIPLL